MPFNLSILENEEEKLKKLTKKNKTKSIFYKKLNLLQKRMKGRSCQQNPPLMVKKNTKQNFHSFSPQRKQLLLMIIN